MRVQTKCPCSSLYAFDGQVRIDYAEEGTAFNILHAKVAV